MNIYRQDGHVRDSTVEGPKQGARVWAIIAATSAREAQELLTRDNDWAEVEWEYTLPILCQLLRPAPTVKQPIVIEAHCP